MYIFTYIHNDIDIYIYIHKILFIYKIGVCKLNLENILSAPIKKTPESYVRVYDAYESIDEVDE